ncbi:MAG: sigma 54-interacting transcriptional regulator, partial [Verrucomicrobiae bacterium]|nr:sigma 54-interacting transcriptional regulator [Verrucomicrobiae bacterium]
VRVIAATNEPLLQKMKEKTFREDLYYRISVIPISLPPLRERGEDLELLVQYFVQTISQRFGMPPPRVSEGVMQVFRAYRWPGNVRELQNAIERACALCDDGVIELKDLPERILEAVAAGTNGGNGHGQTEPTATPVSGALAVQVASAAQFSKGFGGMTLKEFLHQQEVIYIEQAIKAHGGSKEKAAEALGISMATLYRKLSPHPKTRFGVDASLESGT